MSDGVSTYNVLEACRKLNITNVVLASSETLIGIPLNPHPPEFLPVTEENERRPESAYSLSKLVGEVVAEQYTRWNPDAKIVSLRFSNVMLPQEYANFESWQEDPSLRYWNAWGYIGKSLLVLPVQSFALTLMNSFRCERRRPSCIFVAQGEVERSPSVLNCCCRYVHEDEQRRASQSYVSRCEIHFNQGS